MASTTSPNMNLTIPGIGTEYSPTWATDLNASLSAIDSHNHSSGQGVQIQPNGMNINADLAFQSNNATQLRSTRFTSQNAVLSQSTDVGCLYVVGNELYYNDVTGSNNVQITSNGSVNATSSGISSGTASAAFSAGVLVVKSSSTSGANVLMQSAVLTNSGNLSNQMTLSAPTLSGGSTITLPVVPGSQSFLAIDTSGNITAYAGVSGGITGINIVSDVNLPGKAVQENGNNVVVSNTNATTSLAMIRVGITNNSGSLTLIEGEGVSLSLTGEGIVAVTYSTAFADAPVVMVTPAVWTGSPPSDTSSNTAIVSNQSAFGCAINTLTNGALANFDFSLLIVGRRS